MKIVAEVRFGDGSIQLVVGRVKNGIGVPFKDEKDAHSHIAYIRGRGYKVKIMRFV